MNDSTLFFIGAVFGRTTAKIGGYLNKNADKTSLSSLNLS